MVKKRENKSELEEGLGVHRESAAVLRKKGEGGNYRGLW